MAAKKMLFYSCLALFLSLPCFSFVQAERAYTIYESELNRLEQNLITLEEHNRSKQTLLMKQEKQLQEAEKELQIANDLIRKSQIQNERTKQSLQSVNQSLERYEQEAEHKIKVKTRQRNLWILISAGLGYLAMR